MQYAPGTGRVTLTDPEGNLFCVLKSQADSVCPQVRAVERIDEDRYSNPGGRRGGWPRWSGRR